MEGYIGQWAIVTGASTGTGMYICIHLPPLFTYFNSPSSFGLITDTNKIPST
jgi:hypothetical protein